MCPCRRPGQKLLQKIALRRLEPQKPKQNHRAGHDLLASAALLQHPMLSPALAAHRMLQKIPVHTSDHVRLVAGSAQGAHRMLQIIPFSKHARSGHLRMVGWSAHAADRVLQAIRFRAPGPVRLVARNAQGDHRRLQELSCSEHVCCRPSSHARMERSRGPQKVARYTIRKFAEDASFLR